MLERTPPQDHSSSLQRTALVLAVNRRIQRDDEPWLVVDKGGEFLVIDQRSGAIVGRHIEPQTLIAALGLLGEINLEG
jgi:hypothetical protein